MEMILSFVGSLILVICVLVKVTFLTLLKRKVLGYIQIRKGPNKVGFMGILQPFCDAIELFTSEQTYPLLPNYITYYFSSIFSLFISLVVWLCISLFVKLFSFNLGVLFFLCCKSLGVYAVMVAGWSSNFNYALLGGLRAVAQTISYEVSMALILLSFVFLIGGYNIQDFFITYQSYIWFVVIMFPVSLVWFCICLAETNRTPFDFAEGESELVSGFNIEYKSGGFAFIFMAEYASILFMSMLFCVIFFGCNLFNLMFYFKLVYISFVFILVRGTLLRFRYDKLMHLAWNVFLPFSLNYLLFFIGIKLLLMHYMLLIDFSTVNSKLYTYFMFSKHTHMLIQAH